MVDGPIRESHQAANSAEGWTASEIWRVREQTPGSASGILYRAASAVGVPQLGDPHPDIPGIQVLSQNPMPLDQYGALVQVEYGPPEPETDLSVDPSPWVVEYAGTSRTCETNKDYSGTTMQYEYIPSGGGATVTWWPRAQVAYELLRVNARRRQTASPKTFVETYRAAVNSGAWNGYSKKTWLVEDIVAHRINRNTAWMVSVRLLHDRATHKFRSEFRINQRPPTDNAEPSDIDLNDGNGVRYFDLKNVVDFAGMGIVLP